MKKKSRVTAILLAGSLAMASVLADEGAIEGAVVKADDTSLTLKTAKGEEKTFSITDKTKTRVRTPWLGWQRSWETDFVEAHRPHHPRGGGQSPG